MAPTAAMLILSRNCKEASGTMPPRVKSVVKIKVEGKWFSRAPGPRDEVEVKEAIKQQNLQPHSSSSLEDV